MLVHSVFVGWNWIVYGTVLVASIFKILVGISCREGNDNMRVVLGLGEGWTGLLICHKGDQIHHTQKTRFR